jgi:SAM-dependent methyltransferase
MSEFRFAFFDADDAEEAASDAQRAAGEPPGTGSSSVCEGEGGTMMTIPVVVPGELVAADDSVVKRALCGATLAVEVDPALSLRLAVARDVALGSLPGALASAAARTDVESGVYEGGFKLWECSLDVARYLATQGAGGLSQVRSVLDLGCGHGVPGVAAALIARRHGLCPPRLCFQDLNREVLLRLTAPNLALNALNNTEARLVAGDWRALSTGPGGLLSSDAPDGRFDLVLTAETVYSEEAFSVLHDVLASVLAPRGRVLLAAKRFYFGVGGGARGFCELVAARGVLRVTPLAAFEDGSSNIRDLVELTRIAP